MPPIPNDNGLIQRITQLIQIALAIYGLLWGAIVLVQSYESGLSLFLSPTVYALEHTAYFGLGFGIFLLSFFILNEEMRRQA